MLAQAWAYEQRFPHLKLDEFFDSTTGAFHSEPFLGWAQEIRQKRAATLAKNCQKSDESRK
jgi:hypothetical protein